MDEEDPANNGPSLQALDATLTVLVTYMTNEHARAIPRLDLTDLMSWDRIWQEPHVLAVRISTLLRNKNTAWHAEVVTDPGVILTVLGTDDPMGHVISYRGSLSKPNELAYLILRHDHRNMFWQAPLSDAERAAAAHLTQQLRIQLINAAEDRLALAKYMVEVAWEQTQPGAQAVLRWLRQRLWHLTTYDDTLVNMGDEFAKAHLLLLAVIEQSGLHYDEVANRARLRMSLDQS